MSMMPAVDDKISFERRLQSIAQGLILAGLVGVGTMLYGLVKDVTTLSVKNEHMARELSELKSELGGLRTQTMNAALAAANAATAAASVAASSVSARAK